VTHQGSLLGLLRGIRTFLLAAEFAVRLGEPRVHPHCNFCGCTYDPLSCFQSDCPGEDYG